MGWGGGWEGGGDGLLGMVALVLWAQLVGCVLGVGGWGLGCRG